MRENKAEVFAGALVVACAVAFVIYVFQATGLSSNLKSYPLYAQFRSAEGVNVGTDVRLAGVKVGTVSALSLDLNEFLAKSTLSIKSDITIPDDSAFVVSSEGLLGGTFIEIMPGASDDFFQAGDEISDTQGAISIIQLMMRFVSGGSE